MRDYAEILKSMRICLNVDRDSNCLSECFGCNYISHDHHVMDMVRDAADAIEELLAAVRSVVHCKDCEWWTKQEASIQGRCARLAIYPTGAFYCASGSKREPPKGVE